MCGQWRRQGVREAPPPVGEVEGLLAGDIIINHNFLVPTRAVLFIGFNNLYSTISCFTWYTFIYNCSQRGNVRVFLGYCILKIIDFLFTVHTKTGNVYGSQQISFIYVPECYVLLRYYNFIYNNNQLGKQKAYFLRINHSFLVYIRAGNIYWFQQFPFMYCLFHHFMF